MDKWLGARVGVAVAPVGRFTADFATISWGLCDGLDKKKCVGLPRW